MREVLSERLAYAVAECGSYDMPTRHAIGHHGSAASCDASAGQSSAVEESQVCASA